MNTSIDKIIKKLEYFKKELSKTDYIHEKNNFFKVMAELCEYLTTENKNVALKDFQVTEYYKNNAHIFRRYNTYFERALEAKETINILWKNHGIKSWKSIDVVGAKYVQDAYSRKWNDLKDLDMEGEKTLIMVGCWPFPETILYIYENTPIKKIIGLDYNSEAIYLAGEIIRFLWFTDITLKYQDWCKYDYSEADIVYIASFVDLKKEIIDQISETWKKDVQILVRNNSGLNSLRYKHIHLKEINTDFEITAIRENWWKYHSTQMIKLERKDRDK